MFKVWLDDLRPAPEGWLHVANPEGVLLLLKQGLVEEMSLDHDLGEFYRNGTWLVNQIEELVLTEGPTLPPWRIHSANPVGGPRMTRVLTALHKRQQGTSK